MKWIEFLINKLELCNDRKKKIIVDKYLFSKDTIFSNFLNEKSINFLIADNEITLLSNLNKYPNIFFTGDFHKIPSSTKDKKEVIFLDEHLCIAQISSVVFEKLKLEDIKKLLIYLIEKREKLYINESNLGNIIKNAEKLYGKYEISFLEKNIKEKSINLTVENILNIAMSYSRLNSICYEINEKINDEVVNLADKVMLDFILSEKYKNIFYAPDKTITNVLKIIRKTARKKFALLCFDGMGLLEWNIFKKFLINANVNIVNEKLLFTLLPTTTSICRASLFSGKLEECYEKRLNETKEFKNFYDEVKSESISSGDILNGYVDASAIKIVYNFFDDIAHGQSLPALDTSKKPYFQAVENFLKNSTVVDEIKRLMSLGYKIFITSDHGCVVSTGNGVNVDKYLIDSKCKRAIIAEDSKLIEKYKNEVIMFSPPFISNKKILIAKNRESFNYKGAIEISHGGATMEEMIIPLIEVE